MRLWMDGPHRSAASGAQLLLIDHESIRLAGLLTDTASGEPAANC
jgi:hypothetical protein